MSKPQTLLPPHAAVLAVMRGLSSDSWDSFVANKYLCDAISMMKLASSHVTEVKNELANIAGGYQNHRSEHAKLMVDDINSTIDQITKNAAAAKSDDNKKGERPGVDVPAAVTAPVVEDHRPDLLGR